MGADPRPAKLVRASRPPRGVGWRCDVATVKPFILCIPVAETGRRFARKVVAVWSGRSSPSWEVTRRSNCTATISSREECRVTVDIPDWGRALH